MRAIHIKLVRDLAFLRGQAFAIGVVMACGVATFVMSLSVLDSLSTTVDTYYERNRFAEVFAHLKRAPQSLTERIAEIPGVAHVQSRVVERVTLDMPGLPEPASGQIVSLPDDPRSGLNLVHLRNGRFPQGSRTREVLISQRFAESHRLRPGDTVKAVLNGRRDELRVVGVALSPEFVYLISPGGLLPEKKRFGVFWMQRDEMEAAFDMEGAFNDVIISLTPGANDAEVIERIDALTERYGGLGAYTVDDQASHKFVENEMNELRGMMLMVPMIFLCVSAFLLNIVLSRMIATQREQIAALKALGYTRFEVGTHYLGFVMLITLLAVAAGSLLGAWMGRGMTVLYIEFFDFPTFNYLLRPRVIVFGLGVSMLSASIGVAHALRTAMRLPPAEAMRPLAPPTFKPTFLERIGIHRCVPASVRMILRQLERTPARTGLSVLGVALATAILVVGSFTEDAIDYLLDFQFNRVQQYDMNVAFADRVDSEALSSVRHMPGVRTVEPYRTLAARINNGHVSRRVGITGLNRDDGLYKLLDMSGRPVTLPDSGIVLSAVLAELLGVSVGDQVTIEAMEGRRPTFTTEVSSLMDDFSGLSAYMHRDELNRLMHEHNAVGGVYLLADPRETDALYMELRETPSVVAVNVKAATVENFRDTISKNMSLMKPFLVGFSIAIAFGVIYNSARISLSERSRDLATLRVLGFSRREVTAIQLGELAIITGIAIPVGLVLGYLLSWLTSEATSSELVRIPFVIAPSTFAFATIIVTGASIISGFMVLRRLGKLNLVSVLKSRE